MQELDIDNLTCNLDEVRRYIFKLSPADALNSDYLLFSSALPMQLGGLEKSAIDNTLSKLSQKSPNFSKALASAKAEFSKFSKSITISYIVTSLWNPIEKYRNSLAMKSTSDSPELETLYANLFYAVTLSTPNDVSFTQFVAQKAYRKPVLVTCFSDDESERVESELCDLFIPQKILNVVLEIVDSIEIPEDFYFWNSPSTKSLFRASNKTRITGYEADIKMVGKNILRAIDYNFSKIDHNLKKLLEQQCCKLIRRLDVSDLSLKVVFRFWVTQYLWRLAISLEQTNFMYLIPEEFQSGQSALTVGTKTNLDSARLLQLRIFAKEHLSSHLNYQLSHYISENAALANRSFAGHNLPRALADVRRRRIPNAIRAAQVIENKSQRDNLIWQLNIIDKRIQHYDFLLKTAMTSRNLSDMVDNMLTERFTVDEFVSEANDIFAIAADELPSENIRNNILLDINISDDIEGAELLPKDLTIQILTTLINNATQHYEPNLSTNEHFISMNVKRALTDNGYCINITNLCEKSQLNSLLSHSEKIESIFKTESESDLNETINELLNRAISKARESKLGIGLITIAGYLKALQYCKYKSGSGALTIKAENNRAIICVEFSA